MLYLFKERRKKKKDEEEEEIDDIQTLRVFIEKKNLKSSSLIFKKDILNDFQS